ncbi:hypothetical protein B0G93_11418 [Bacillus sp. V-88]|jgi:hypothetical protein|nr:hypothetical protein B0G93_11418 [Bacillus sp. V-88]SLK23593.1 hypothetical protein SAMN06295884_11418 [Bacillus sp. V-88]
MLEWEIDTPFGYMGFAFIVFKECIKSYFH